MQITEEKNALRREIRALRAALPEGYLARAGAGIAGAVAACPEYRAARTVMGFVSTPEEADLRPLLRQILRDGKRLAVPLCTGPGIMEARLISGLEQLAPGRYGILEPPAASPLIPPEDIGLLIVPCVTCSPAASAWDTAAGITTATWSTIRGPPFWYAPTACCSPAYQWASMTAGCP